MRAHFQRDSKGMSWFILSILFILAIPIILPSLFSCQVYGPGTAGFLGLEGPWSIIANNQPGKLEFYLAGGVWAGRIWFDVLQQWDDLTNISFDPSTGHLKFYRPVYGQEYNGTVSGKQIVGTFLPGGPKIVNTSWQAWRGEQEQRPRPVEFRGLEGPWSIIANNQPGKLEFYLAGGVWAGRIWFDVLQQWDDLTNISFDPRTGHLKFYRPVYGQEYYGTVSVKRIVGTFLPGGPTIVNTSWEAWRP